MNKILSITACGAILSGCAGTPPAHIGLHEGRLTSCPDKPNCVISQEADPGHHIDPIAYSGAQKDALARLKTLIRSMERTRIVAETENYLRVECTTKWLGFVDDLEFYFPAEPIIHVRSASRLGYSDLGVNRKRVEQIRKRFNE